MKPLLIILTLLCVACDHAHHEYLIVTSVQSPPLDKCDYGKKHQIVLNKTIFLHTDSLYSVGDTIK